MACSKKNDRFVLQPYLGHDDTTPQSTVLDQTRVNLYCSLSLTVDWYVSDTYELPTTRVEQFFWLRSGRISRPGAAQGPLVVLRK
jgi:hypothetical protein